MDTTAVKDYFFLWSQSRVRLYAVLTFIIYLLEVKGEGGGDRVHFNTYGMCLFSLEKKIRNLNIIFKDLSINTPHVRAETTLRGRPRGFIQKWPVVDPKG